MEIEFAPHIEEIKRALDTEIDNDRIREDLKKLLEYRVPLAEAKRSLIRKYGGVEKSIVRKLGEIEIGDHDIEVTAKVMEISKRTINVKNNEKAVFGGIIRDETAARNFTAWEDFGLNTGDVIRVTHAYVRNWQERPQVNFGPRSKITKLQVKMQLSQETGQKKLSELRDGEINVHTSFRILKIEPREISTKDGIKKILNGIIADEATKLPMTAWTLLPEFEVGNTLEVKNAYVRSFRGVPTLHINENSTVTRLDSSIDHKEPHRILIGNLIEKDGAFDVVVEGNILSIRPGSGLINRCPQCNRVIQKSICRVHGKVDEIPDMRIKAIIDDGTGALMVVLDAGLTQEVCSLTIEKAKMMAKAAMSAYVVEEEIKKKLMGKILSVRGNMSKGEFGITLVASKVNEPEDMTGEKANELIQKAGHDGKDN
ncbi:MAG TPA: Single-stranded DNA binding protein [Candidatus Methanoperedens sp.]